MLGLKLNHVSERGHSCPDIILLMAYSAVPLQHSVESPRMVDPQWNIWYWGSKWNLHTVCWSAVGCEWGTTSVYFGITYVCFIPSRLPVFAVEPQYLLQYFFYFCQKYHLNYTYKIFKKFHVGLKFEWGLQDQYWLSCERLPFEVFFICLCEGLPGIAYANMLVTTQWPLKRAAHLTSLVWVCVLWLPWKLNGAICAMTRSIFYQILTKYTP